MQVFGAIDEDQTIGFPVAGKNAAANVRYIPVLFMLVNSVLCFQVCYINIF